MGSVVESPEPGDIYRELMAKKQSLQMELRQRSVSESNYFVGSKLAISIASARGAVRLGLASGPGLLVCFFSSIHSMIASEIFSVIRIVVLYI